jgi:hypothetical protein
MADRYGGRMYEVAFSLVPYGLTHSACSLYPYSSNEVKSTSMMMTRELLDSRKILKSGQKDNKTHMRQKSQGGGRL